MARICGFHGVSVVKNLLGKASRQSTSLCFRYVSHGGHIAHEQARIEAEATNGSGRKHSLYKGLGVRHRAIHEINGACPSLPAARNPNPLIHGNSTWNVEEPHIRHLKAILACHGTARSEIAKEATRVPCLPPTPARPISDFLTAVCAHPTHSAAGPESCAARRWH